MATETSINSLEMLEGYALGPCQKQVYEYIKKHPDCSLKDISLGTGLLQENVCGRKKTLEEQGLIRKSGTKYNPDTDRMVETWVIHDGTKVESNIECLTNNEMKKIQKLIDKANTYQKNKISSWCLS